MLQKNVASQKWRVFAFDVTTGVAKTGDAAQITAKIDKDWAGAGATNDVNPTETEDGYYNFNLTQAETNADALDLFPESSTSNIAVIGVPGSQSTRIIQTGDSFARLGAPAGDDVAADIIALKTVADAIPTTAMRGTDSAALATVCTEARLAELAAANLPADIDAILLDTGTTLDGKLDTIDDFLDTEIAAILVDTGTSIPALIAALENLSAAEVNAEVDTALVTTTYAEPGSVPAATASLKDKIGWLFALDRNKLTQTSTTKTLRNDADSGNIATSAVSDDGTTATRGEYS